MAAKSFLSKESVPLFSDFFIQSFREMSQLGQNWSWLSEKLSQHLSDHLTSLLNSLPSKPQVQVVKLGSWSRGELCPRSDIDVILLGQESHVLSFVSEAADAGVRLQYRVPLNRKDWMEGVEDFDHLALMYAECFEKKIEPELQAQKKMAWDRAHQLKMRLAELMKEERDRRNQRYDSLANYLEPNLKYGPGALRDLEQALVTVSFYPEIFESYKKEISYLENRKAFLLVLRYALHLQGHGDIFVATAQESTARQLGFASRLEFTSKLQDSLSEINFYSQWVFELIGTNPVKVEKVKAKTVSHLGMAVEMIMKDHSLVVIEKIREIIKRLELDRTALDKVKAVLNGRLPEEKFIAFFQAGVFYKVFHHLRRAKGLVQYDHYHRYTVDAHTLQALRYFCKSRKDPEKYLGKNKEWVMEFSEQDWDVLLWALLYHDMAKGLPGSHSELGGQIAVEELSAMGFSSAFYQEVAWLVRNHLALSEATFRKNPEDPSTWQWLNDKGLRPQRLKLLASLTAIDIMATNFEAWTPWKSDLMYRLVRQVLSPQVESFVQLGKELEGAAEESVVESFLTELQPMLASSVPTHVIHEDFFSLIRANNGDLPILVWQQDSDHSWVRFHSLENRSGLFLHWSQLLFMTGCLVREAYIHTFSEWGAYNCFMISTRKKAKVLKKQLGAVVSSGSLEKLSVRFDSIKLVSDSREDQWIIRFKGKDQQGALLVAVQALFDQGLEIQWARVHTWGNILEDIFAVARDHERTGDELIESLRQKYC